MNEHIKTAGRHIGTAERHARAAVSAFENGDDREVARAHRLLRDHLREAKMAIDRADAADAANGDGGGGAQTSSGFSDGKSGRAGSPLLTGDVLGWLDRARQARRP